MAQPDDTSEPAGVNTPESAILGRLANAYRVVFALSFIAIAWLLATIAAAYFSITSPTGTFGQGLATNALASLILVAIAPVLFSVLLHESRWYFLLFVAIAAAIVGLAATRDGGLRDFLLNLGCGLWFLVAVDYYISRRFEAWVEKLAAETQESVRNAQRVL